MIRAQNVDQIKLEIKKEFDGILHEKNKEILVISEKVRKFIVPFFEEFKKINSFMISCPSTFKSLTVKNLVSSTGFEFRELFQTDLINDILSEVIISIETIQDFFNQLEISENNEKCFRKEKEKFAIIFAEFLDSVKEASNLNLAAMRDEFNEIGSDVKKSLNEIQNSCEKWNNFVRNKLMFKFLCKHFSFQLELNFDVAKEKIQFWRKSAHEVINNKIEDFQLQTENLTQKSIDKFDDILLKISTCE